MNKSPFRIQRSTWQGILLVAIAATTLLVSAYAHVKAGFTLPNPWNDEPWLLWSSISFMEGNTLFSESLNPDRIVFLSPLFQISLGLLFKVTGFSFSLARWVSWGFLMVAYSGILVLVKSKPMPLISAGVASLFFLGVASIVAGNMVRPEALVLALAVWSYILADRGLYWRALSLAGVGILIHQIGIVFFGGIFFLFLLWGMKSPRQMRPSRGDWIGMGLAAILLLVHLSFLVPNWTLVIADLNSSAGETFKQTLMERIFHSNKTPWLFVFLGLLGAGLWRLKGFLPMILLGFCAYFTMILRPQMWYEVYNQIAFLVLTLVLSWIAYRLAFWVVDLRSSRSHPRISKLAPLAAFGLTLLLMLNLCYRHGFVTGPRNYPDKLGWAGMKFDASPYLTEQDVNIISGEIRRHVEDGLPHRVFFMPEGDALFFYGKLPAQVIPYQGVRTTVKGDLAVFRLSRHQPDWWYEQHVRKSLVEYGGEEIRPFYTRDGTEQWILVPPHWSPEDGKDGREAP